MLQRCTVLGGCHKSGPIPLVAWLGRGPPLTLVLEYHSFECYIFQLKIDSTAESFRI